MSVGPRESGGSSCGCSRVTLAGRRPSRNARSTCSCRGRPLRTQVGSSSTRWSLRGSAAAVMRPPPVRATRLRRPRSGSSACAYVGSLTVAAIPRRIYVEIPLKCAYLASISSSQTHSFESGFPRLVVMEAAANHLPRAAGSLEDDWSIIFLRSFPVM